MIRNRLDCVAGDSSKRKNRGLFLVKYGELAPAPQALASWQVGGRHWPTQFHLFAGRQCRRRLERNISPMMLRFDRRK